MMKSDDEMKYMSEFYYEIEYIMKNVSFLLYNNISGLWSLLIDSISQWFVLEVGKYHGKLHEAFI